MKTQQFVRTIVIVLMLAACNLQSQPPVTLTPTSEPTTQPLQTPTSALPPLQATPTQLPLFGQPQATAAIDITVNPGSGSPSAAKLDPNLFDGRFEVEALSDGETIGIVYEVSILRGSILMVLQGANGIVWQKTLTTSENSRADVPVPKAGVYELLIDAQNLSGEYQFRFE